ncbi:ankyrin repeat-containing domain protein [Morchella snyderi]|nr:ankyrin repeat-containing domain protein [Morchella snyderi]
MSSSPPCLLLSLPPEILLLIANYLNRRGWAFLARTCSAMNCLLATKLDNYFEDNIYRPMLWAARHERPYTLERGLLLRAANPGPDIEDWRNVQAILLNQAISNRSCAALRVLLSNDVDPNRMVKGSSVPPLTAAVQGGSYRVVKMLLRAHADVNYRHAAAGGWTPVAQARWDGNERLVELLLSYGAEVLTDSDFDVSCSGDDDGSDSSAEGDAS